MNPHLLYLVHEKTCKKGENIVVNLAGDVCCTPLSPPCGPLQYQSNSTPEDGSAVEDRMCVDYRTSCPSEQIYDPADTPTGKDRSCAPCPSGQRKDTETTCISEPCEGAWTYLDTCNQLCGEKTRQKQYNITSQNKVGCPHEDKYIQNEACPSEPACVSCRGNWTSFESCDHTCGDKQILETYNLTVVGNDGSVCPADGSTRTTTCPSKSLCPETQTVSISMQDPDNLGGKIQLTNGTETIEFAFDGMTNSYTQDITCGPDEWTVSCSGSSSSGTSSTTTYQSIVGHCDYSSSTANPQYASHGGISTAACEAKCESNEELGGSNCIAYGSKNNEWCNTYTACVPEGMETWGGSFKKKESSSGDKSTIKITVRDTYGDGLNGTTFKVTNNGTTVKENLFSGFTNSHGPDIENVEVSCGDVKVSCEGGSYPEEVKYKIGTTNNETEYSTEKTCNLNNHVTFDIPCSSTSSSSSQTYSLASADISVSSSTCEEKKFSYTCPLRYYGPDRYYINQYTGKKKSFVDVEDCAQYAQQEGAQVFAKYENKCWLYEANDTQQNLEIEGKNRTGSSMESYLLY